MTAPFGVDDPRWMDLFPNPDERNRWYRAFDGYPGDVAAYREHFTDPDVAAAWAHAGIFKAATAAHLHAHGIPANLAIVTNAYLDGFYDRPKQDIPAARTRAALILTHPHLTRADRDAILAARLPLPEVDHLIATDTYDRDQIALLGGLT